MYEQFQKFWNKKWSKAKFIPHSSFAKMVIEYLNEPPIDQKILDIGCGIGRDSLYFSSFWMNVTAFDFSQNALSFLNDQVLDTGLTIKTVLWDMREYNFQQEEYDVIYACNSLHYFWQEETIGIINKLKKSLKEWGYIFLRAKSIQDVDYGKWLKIEENFYKNGEDIKYYFDTNFMKKIFSDFEIIKLEDKKDTHNKIDGSVTINGFIDLVAKK